MQTQTRCVSVVGQLMLMNLDLKCDGCYGIPDMSELWCHVSVL